MNDGTRPEMSPLDDKALIKAFLRGKAQAFDSLVMRYQKLVYSVCYRFLGNHEDADDCAQETFVKVYRSLKSFRFESAFSTWLYRIAANTCKNKMATAEYKYKRRTVALDAPKTGKEGDMPREIKDESASPRDNLEAKEKMDTVQKAIDGLAYDHKAVVVLRDVQGLAYEEIAQVTGYNLGTVKSKLSRARRQLKEMLRGKM